MTVSRIAGVAAVMLIAGVGSAQAQAFSNFAGNLALSRVTMQPVDAQRRRAVAQMNARRLGRERTVGWSGQRAYARFGYRRGYVHTYGGL